MHIAQRNLCIMHRLRDTPHCKPKHQRRTVMLQEYRPEACSSAVPYSECCRMTCSIAYSRCPPLRGRSSKPSQRYTQLQRTFLAGPEARRSLLRARYTAPTLPLRFPSFFLHVYYQRTASAAYLPPDPACSCRCHGGYPAIHANSLRTNCQHATADSGTDRTFQSRNPGALSESASIAGGPECRQRRPAASGRFTRAARA